MLNFNQVEGKKTWVSTDEKYMVEESIRPGDEPVYFCYRRNRIGDQEWCFLTSRETPEIAREYCSIMAGFK